MFLSKIRAPTYDLAQESRPFRHESYSILLEQPPLRVGRIVYHNICTRGLSTTNREGVAVFRRSRNNPPPLLSLFSFLSPSRGPRDEAHRPTSLGVMYSNERVHFGGKPRLFKSFYTCSIISAMTCTTGYDGTSTGEHNHSSDSHARNTRPKPSNNGLV